MAQTVAAPQLVRVGPQGRIVIPAAPRRTLNLRPGDVLAAWVEGDRLVLRPRRAIEEELWSQFAGVADSMADELIAERRREARRGAEES